MRIADHAARSYLARHGYRASSDEFDDMRGEAALAICESLRRVRIERDVRRYAFVAGLHAAGMMLLWWRYGAVYKMWPVAGAPQIVPLFEQDLVADMEDDGDVEETRDPGPVQELLGSKRLAELTTYLCSGYSDDGIANEMGIKRRSVVAFRNTIRKRLVHVLEERGSSL